MIFKRKNRLKQKAEKMGKDYYSILGVGKNATDAEVRFLDLFLLAFFHLLNHIINSHFNVSFVLHMLIFLDQEGLQEASIEMAS